MKLALITDAWRPQINGVVTTLSTVTETLRGFGHTVETFTPDQFRNWPCPTYPEIRLALGCRRGLHQRLEAFAPEAIHIATEGPLGLAARSYCLKRGLPFTSFTKASAPTLARSSSWVCTYEPMRLVLTGFMDDLGFSGGKK